ncbi:MAG: hypothetical protein ABIV07_04095 [Polaromonas sp.]
MTANLALNNEPPTRGDGLAGSARALLHDLDKQRLRILRCTAQAMASGPGGLRYRAGTRPWLDGLPVGRGAAGPAGRCANAASAAAAD